MNTKQLAVLWYVMLVVLFTLIAGGWGIKSLAYNDYAKLAIGAILFGGLAIFSMKKTIQFDQKLFIKWMSVPAILIAAIISIVIYNQTNHQRNQRLEVLPSAVQAKIQGSLELNFGSLFQGDIYNGTHFSLRNIIITITAKEKTGEVRWSREYSDDIFIEPLKTGRFQVTVVNAENASLSWKIVQVKGISTGLNITEQSSSSDGNLESSNQADHTLLFQKDVQNQKHKLDMSKIIQK